MQSNQIELPGTGRKPGPKGPRGKDVINVAGVTLYSSYKIADMLDTTRQSVAKFIKSGDLKGQKIGGKWYVSSGNLQAFLED